MAENIDLNIGGEVISVPKWATEDTLNDILKSNIETGKLIKRAFGTKSDPASIFDEMDKSQKKHAKTTKDVDKEQKKFTESLKESSKSLGNYTKDLAKELNKGNFSNFVEAAAGAGLLGATLGFAAGVLESYSKSLTELVNVGGGLGTTLQDLRGQSAQAGLNIESFSKVTMANSEAMMLLGGNFSAGSANFAQLSQEARMAARDLNQFGLSNSEYNEILAEEIDLRRRSGMSYAEVQERLTSSMNDMLYETTALAAITGQDRREMLRNRQAVMQSSVIEGYMLQLEKTGENTELVRSNMGALASILGRGGDTGNTFAGAIAEAIATNRDFTAVQQGAFAELSNLSGGVVSKGFRDVFEFARDNIADMPSDEFALKIQSMLGEIAETVSPEDLQNLQQFATSGNQTAEQLLSFIANIQGLNSDIQENSESFKEASAAIASSDLLALGSELETLKNNIQELALDTVLDTLGINVEDAGSTLVDAIRTLSNKIAESDNALDLAKDAARSGLGTTAALVGGGYVAGKVGARVLGGKGTGSRATARGGSKIGRLFSTTKSVGGALAATAKTKGLRGMMASIPAGAATIMDRLSSAPGAGAAAAAKGGAKGVGKAIAKRLPGLGLILGLAAAGDRLMDGDFLGAGIDVLSGVTSLVPGLGTAASVGLDATNYARDRSAQSPSRPMTPEEHSAEVLSRFPANHPATQGHSKVSSDQLEQIRAAVEEHNRLLRRQLDIQEQNN